jgi:hypothetical protein
MSFQLCPTPKLISSPSPHLEHVASWTQTVVGFECPYSTVSTAFIPVAVPVL